MIDAVLVLTQSVCLFLLVGVTVGWTVTVDVQAYSPNSRRAQGLEDDRVVQCADCSAIATRSNVLSLGGFTHTRASYSSSSN